MNFKWNWEIRYQIENYNSYGFFELRKKSFIKKDQVQLSSNWRTSINNSLNIINFTWRFPNFYVLETYLLFVIATPIFCRTHFSPWQLVTQESQGARAPGCETSPARGRDSRRGWSSGGSGGKTGTGGSAGKGSHCRENSGGRGCACSEVRLDSQLSV